MWKSVESRHRYVENSTRRRITRSRRGAICCKGSCGRCRAVWRPATCSPGQSQGTAYLLLLAGRVAQRHRNRTGNPGDFGRQFAAGDIIAPAEQRRRHHRVFHLPQVSRPVITHHGRSGFAVEPDDMLVQLAVGLVEEKSAYSMISSRICLTSGIRSVNSLIRW